MTYKLIDQQDTTFCEGIIYKNLAEVAEQFIFYAHTDSYKNINLKGWSISDMLDNWCFELVREDGKELSETELNYIHNK